MSAIALLVLANVVVAQNAPMKIAAMDTTRPPMATGAPHLCGEYPVQALQTSAQGTTLLAFKITAEGRVEDPTVKTPSGDPELDNAAVSCVQQWQYLPAVKNGVAAEAAWQAAVKWEMAPAPPFDQISDAAYRCVELNGIEPVSSKNLRAVARVHFLSGVIDTVAIVGSSGDPVLDRQVAQCYSSTPSRLTAVVPGDMSELLTPFPEQSK